MAITNKAKKIQSQKVWRKKWVEALRSGKYPQGTAKLHKLKTPSQAEGFCCLGVLCDLAVKEGVIPPPTRPIELYNYEVYDAKESPFGTYPSKAVADLVGLATTDGMFVDAMVAVEGMQFRNLSELNDFVRGISGQEIFNKVADLIENKQAGLFV